MLLLIWSGKIRGVPAAPKRWPDVAFHRLRTQGAFLVSTKRQAGVTQFVTVESLTGSPCLVQTDIPNLKIYINGMAANRQQVRQGERGVYEIAIKWAIALPSHPELDEADLTIEPIPVSEANRNLFGLSDKTTRLPGHKSYYRE